jgi:hypothetical protein
MTASGKVYIGRTRDGLKVYVSARLEYANNELWRETTDHTMTTDRLRVAFQGVVVRKGGTIERDGDWESCGQVLDALRDVVMIAEGWSVEGVANLINIWHEWHLNDMQAGCEHQPHSVKSYNVATVEPCPVTGYKYGSKWLHKPLTYEVFTWVCERFEIEPPAPGSKA